MATSVTPVTEPSARASSATHTKAMLQRRWKANFHRRGPRVTPESVVDFLKNLHSTAPQRTHSVMCPDPHSCQSDTRCPRQLAASSVSTYLRLLQVLPCTATHRSVLTSSAVRAYRKELKKDQESKGRYANPGDPIFHTQTVEIFGAGDQIAARRQEENALLKAVRAEQCLTALSFDNHLWRRNGELCAMFARNVMISIDPDGTERIHCGLSPERKISGTAGRYATARAIPGDPTCPVMRLRKLKQTLDSHDIDVTVRLFPVLEMRDGKIQARESQCTHKRACSHSFRTHPYHRQPDCHPECEEWGWPCLSTDTVNDFLIECCREANIVTSYRVHSFRTTPVLIMLQNGVQVSTICAQMGWAENSNMWAQYARLLQFHSVHHSRVINPTAIMAAMDAARNAQPAM